MLLINDIAVKYFIFSGGEIQLQLPEISTERVILTWKPASASDVMLLALTVNALINHGISDIELDVLYLPYARQDRVCSKGEANSLQVICDILDVLDLTLIRFWDVHNQLATEEALDQSHIYVTAAHIFERFKILDDFDLSNLRLCSPDLGARQRVEEVANLKILAIPFLFEKTRDPNTGQIINIIPSKYNGEIDGYNVLVIDDICDGGATFLEVGKQLKELGADKLYLYVTHGIFSKGFDQLHEYYDHIYCHHLVNCRPADLDFLTVLRSFPDAA